ncbi:lysostaphin resistance A-like protein [Sunxiuqinia sp. A32]|uniref:lysostaphin resistance A-like protein n=1 Tax=Sunxiuqinia sp. A32 TaxID=3461496 RepID=UPI004045D800
MAIKAFRGMSPWSQFIFAAFIILVTFLVVFIVGVIAIIPFVGLEGMISSLSGSVNSPEAIKLLKYFQTIQSIGLFVLPPFIIAYLYEGQIRNYLMLNRGFTGKAFILAITAMLVSLPFIGFTGELNSKLVLPEFMVGVQEWMQNMEDNATELIDRFMDVKTTGGLLFNLFMIAVIPALGEEFLFRGVIQKIFINMTRNHHWGIWISAFLFSALHMQFFGFVPRMLLGALFGYMLVWSRSMWLPVLGHFVNNAIGVMALHVQNQANEKIAEIGEFAETFSVSWIVALLSLGITISLLLVLKKETTESVS